MVVGVLMAVFVVMVVLVWFLVMNTILVVLFIIFVVLLERTLRHGGRMAKVNQQGSKWAIKGTMKSNKIILLRYFNKKIYRDC